ncbi:MAG: MauE/DoxX family redox-associated membrane protein [Acidimicrobiia bacterium]
MSIVGTVASIVVGAAFVLAGASKVAAGRQWPATARDMGAPAATIPLVPWVEIAVGAALVAQLASPIPAIAALGLLVAFTALIVVRLAAGDRPPCACFGAWSAEPLGATHVVRNVVLIALTVLAIVA